MEHKRPESVLIIVYTRQSEVLLLRRRYPNDFWQSVTGSLEWGEQPGDAAVRELREETGLVGQAVCDSHCVQSFEIYSIWRKRYAPGVVMNQEHVYRLQLPKIVDIRLDPKEHEEFQWLPRQQAAELATSHTNQAAILRWVPE